MNSIGEIIGSFDGKSITSLSGQILYFVEDRHIFSVNSPRRYIGELEYNTAYDIWGHLIFRLRDE